jgi:ATP/maltotriose-dependent transcriptional regulator MalT
VLRLLARGLSSRQIDAELVITTKTARNHTETHLHEDRHVESHRHRPVFHAPRTTSAD